MEVGREAQRMERKLGQLQGFQYRVLLLLKALFTSSFVAILWVVALSGCWKMMPYRRHCLLWFSGFHIKFVQFSIKIGFFLALSLRRLACLFRVELCSWLKKFLCRWKFKRLSLGPVQHSYSVIQLQTATEIVPWVILQQEFKSSAHQRVYF